MSLVAGIALSVGVLIIQMVNEKAQLGAIASALADLNEMRLSKFEYALFTTKLMEDFLDVKVEYNFVRHFYTDRDAPGGTLFPDIRPYAVIPAPSVPNQPDSMQSLGDVDAGGTHSQPHTAVACGQQRVQARRGSDGGRCELGSACSSINGSFSMRLGDAKLMKIQIPQHTAALTRRIVVKKTAGAALQLRGSDATVKAAARKVGQMQQRVQSITLGLEDRGVCALFDDDADELELEVEAGEGGEDGEFWNGDERETELAERRRGVGLWVSASSLRTSMGDVEVEC